MSGVGLAKHENYVPKYEDSTMGLSTEQPGRDDTTEAHLFFSHAGGMSPQSEQAEINEKQHHITQTMSTGFTQVSPIQVTVTCETQPVQRHLRAHVFSTIPRRFSHVTKNKTHKNYRVELPRNIHHMLRRKHHLKLQLARTTGMIYSTMRRGADGSKRAYRRHISTGLKNLGVSFKGQS